jgi:hypothetical protein
MRGAKTFGVVVAVVCATACSAGTDKAPTPATSSAQNSVKNEVYLTDLWPQLHDTIGNFEPGEGVIGGAKYSHSVVWSCDKSCLPVGQSGQQNQPGIAFKVPQGFNRLEFVVGLTDSSTETDRHVGVGVYTYASPTDAGTDLFKSQDVPVGAVTPVSVAVSPGNSIRIDGWALNGNETLCICDPKLVEIAG